MPLVITKPLIGQLCGITPDPHTHTSKQLKTNQDRTNIQTIFNLGLCWWSTRIGFKINIDGLIPPGLDSDTLIFGEDGPISTQSLLMASICSNPPLCRALNKPHRWSYLKDSHYDSPCNPVPRDSLPITLLKGLPRWSAFDFLCFRKDFRAWQGWGVLWGSLGLGNSRIRLGGPNSLRNLRFPLF